MSNRQTDLRLAKLYARLPKLECAGRCSSSCGPIACSRRERTRVQAAAGRELATQPAGAVLPDGRRQPISLCSLLEPDGRCAGYDARPMICRLWGVVETMRCPHGCKPDPRYLTVEEAHDFNRRAFELGGWPALERIPAWDPTAAIRTDLAGGLR